MGGVGVLGNTAGGGGGAGAALTTLAHRTLHVLRTLDDVDHHHHQHQHQHQQPNKQHSGDDDTMPSLAWAAEGARALVTAMLTDGGCGSGAASVWDDPRVSATCPPVASLIHVLLRWAMADVVVLDAASGCRLLAALAAVMRAGATAVSSASGGGVGGGGGGGGGPSLRSPAGGRRTNLPPVRLWGVVLRVWVGGEFERALLVSVESRSRVEDRGEVGCGCCGLRTDRGQA